MRAISSAFNQVTVTTTAGGLTVPATASDVVVVTVDTDAVRWRDDGTNPTSTVGHKISAGDLFVYDGDLSAIKFIRDTSSSSNAVLNCSYYAEDGIPAQIRKTSAGSASATLGGSLPAGNNNIGDVDIASMPGAARTTDAISAALATDAIMNNLTALTPKFAPITASASGATNIVAVVASKKLRILAWSLVCNAAVNVKWQSATTTGTATGLHYFAANGGISVPFSPVGHFETVAGEALAINLSGAVAVGGHVVYVEV